MNRHHDQFRMGVTVISNFDFYFLDDRLSRSSPLMSVNIDYDAIDDSVNSSEPKQTTSEIPDGLMDILSFLSALIATIAMAPLIAFGYEDMNAADVRYLNYHTTNSSYFGKHPVSSLVALFASWSGILSGMSLITIILVRCTLAMAKTFNLPQDVMQSLHQRLKPCFYAGATFLIIAVISFPLGYYWLGWLVFQPDVVSGNLWKLSGGSLCFL